MSNAFRATEGNSMMGKTGTNDAPREWQQQHITIEDSLQA
jgi:hypothetical protein